MEKSTKNKILIYIASGIAFLRVIVYLLYHLFFYSNNNIVTEFAYQHTEKQRRISVICYKERETYYAIRGYAWNVPDSFTAMQTSNGVRMNIGPFFDCPTKILNGCYFTVNNGKPVAGTIVRIRGKRA